MTVFHRAKFYAFFELPRPLNCTITFLSVLLGGWLGMRALSPDLFIAALSAAFITGGGNALNDLCGIAEDRINKPHRPLPSGRISAPAARVETILLLLIGLTLALPLSNAARLIALIAVIGLILYNVYLKRVLLLGNLTVSALGSLAFLYGGAAAGNFSAAYLIAIFAFLFHFGREILKDLEDCAGDRHLSSTTIPLLWGNRAAQIWITATFVLLICLMPLPAVFGIYTHHYLIPIGLLNGLLIFILIRLWQGPSPLALRFLSHLLKFGMLLGLMAFFVSTL